MKTYHDYSLCGYSINSKNKEICFELEFDGQVETLLFKNVYGYEFKNDSLPSIIFEIVETPIEEFYMQYADSILKSHRQNGAYGNWASNLSKAKRVFSLNKSKIMTVSSSIGIEGWVIVESVVAQA